MIVKYDEDNFSIKLYRDFVKGKLVGLMEVIPIDELLEVWEKHKAEQTEPKAYCKKKNCVWWSTSLTECLAEKSGHKCKYKTEQTENSSEKPNNSTISKMEQVDKDINVRSKDEPQTDCPWK